MNECIGIRRPVIVEGRNRLEEAIDKLATDLYTSKQEDVAVFVKTLPVVDTAEISKKPASLPRTRTIARIAVSLDDVSLPPQGMARVQCKITNVPHAQVVKEKLVLVSQNPRNTICSVSQGSNKFKWFQLRIMYICKCVRIMKRTFINHTLSIYDIK